MKLDSCLAEVEYQRTNVALGKPVDVEGLLTLAERAALDAVQWREESERANRSAADEEDRANGYMLALQDLIRSVEKVVANLTPDRVNKKDRLELVAWLESAVQQAKEDTR